MSLRSLIRGAVLALAFTATQAGVASAATTTVVPSAAEARSFATTNGGWVSSVDYNGLVCIPGVTCPTANPTYRSTGGLDGVADGHVRNTFGTLLGVLSTTSIIWTSPSFVAPSSIDAATLELQIRPQIASLLAIGTVSVQTRIVDVADPSQTFVVADTPLTAASAGFAPRQLTVDPTKLVAGRTYQIQTSTNQTTNVSAVTSGNVDFDSIALTLSDLDLPLNLVGSVTGNALSGTVETNGTSTDVSVEYGLTTAYGSSTTPVTVTGSGSRPFNFSLPNLTPGETYHYRVVATNADGTVRTADDTFVAAALPETTVPVVTGAGNSRTRTVTFTRAGDVSAASIEILDGTLSVVDTILDAGDDGTQTITLPDADGTYGIRVVRTNLSALSSTSSTVSAVLDRVAPSLTGLTLGVTPALSAVAQRTVAFVRPLDAATVSAQVIDAANVDVGAPVTLAGNGGAVQLGSTDGDYRVRLTFTDAAGNSAQTTSGTLTLDTTAPGGGAPTVAGDGSSRQRTVTFARDGDVTSALVEVLDAHGTVVVSAPVASGASVGVTLPDTDGAYTVRVTQTDAAAHVTVSATTAIELDRVAPVAGDAPTVDGTPGALSVRFARAQDAATAAIEVLDAAGTVLFTIAVPAGDHATVALPATAGVYGIRAVQADAAGNVSRTAVTPVTRSAEVVPPKPPVAPVGTPTPTPTPTPAAPAQLAPNAPATIAVGQQGNTIALPIQCPAGQSCEVSGALRITASAFASRAVASAASDVVVARFSGLKIRAGSVKNAKLRIPTSFVRRAQRANLRTVRATLTIRTVRADGSVMTKKSRLTLTIPKAKRRAAVVRPKFTG
jgi:hypothetical protein